MNDGETTAAILAAAITALISAKAPRRTISSIAAAIVRARFMLGGGDEKATAILKPGTPSEPEEAGTDNGEDARFRLRERRKRARTRKKERAAAAKVTSVEPVKQAACPASQSDAVECLMVRGQRAVLHSLVKRTDLNGSIVELIEWLEEQEDGSLYRRWHCKVISTGEMTNLLPSNMKRVRRDGKAEWLGGTESSSTA